MSSKEERCPKCGLLIISGTSLDDMGREWFTDRPGQDEDTSKSMCEDCAEWVIGRQAVRRAHRKGFTEWEAWIVMWQYRMVGGFDRQLIELICKADCNNKAKLALGFPDQVAVVRDWQEGNLALRFRAVGISV